jgi:hypothetical protein
MFDVTTNRLSYDLTVSGVATDDIHGVDLHRSEGGDVGAVIYRLSGPGARSRSGTVMLDTDERDSLMDGTLYLEIYTRERPAGAARAQLVIPPA